MFFLFLLFDIEEKEKTILITGVNGFIGQYIGKELMKDFKVIGLDIVDNNEKKWNKLIELCEMLERIKELEIIDKNIGNERRKLKEGLEKILVEVDKKEINKIIEEAKKLSLEKAENNNYSLVYWKDELGEHSYCVE